MSEPLLSRGLGGIRSTGEASIIMLNPSDGGDILIYERLHNERENFSILSETDHAGKFTVFVVIRYLRLADVVVGKSSAEGLIEEYKKKKKSKKKAINKKAHRIRSASKKPKDNVVGLAPGTNP